MDRTSLDSLVQTVRELSGEDSVVINGTKTLIIERESAEGRRMAADYIEQRLRNYNLTLSIPDCIYSYVYNIIATQPGIRFPDSIFFICAHYDAADFYCADDNASGAAAVLEAARILSDISFDYTIKYAFWDLEEFALTGSRCYTLGVSDETGGIITALNLDMIGYDSNDDGLIDIHANEHEHSIMLANELLNTIETYDLSLVPVVYNPGMGGSDHVSFWNTGFGANLLIEAHEGGDFNPYYHSEEDRIDKFNLAYFKEISKLATGTISSLASGGISLNRRCLEITDTLVIKSNAKGIIYLVTEGTDMVLDSVIGKQVMSVFASGFSEFRIPLTAFEFGNYTIHFVRDTNQVISNSKTFSIVPDIPDVTIRVKDFITGKGINDCEVDIGGYISEITDENGEIYLNGQHCIDQPWQLALTFNAQDYNTLSYTFDVFSDTVVEIFLGYDINLKVEDRANSDPVFGALVRAVGSVTRTDTEGNAVISNLRDRTLVYKIEHENYFTLEDSIILTARDTLIVQLTRNRADVKFEVRDFGGPVPYAFVTMDGLRTTTDEEGNTWHTHRFALQVHQYNVEKECYLAVTDSLFLETDTTVQIVVERDTILPELLLSFIGDTLHAVSSKPGEICFVPPGTELQIDSIFAYQWISFPIVSDRPVQVPVSDLPGDDYWAVAIDHCQNLSGWWITGIDQRLAARISIYPNPTYNRITIETDELSTYTLTIISMNGQVKLQKEFHGQKEEFDLSSLPKGIYIISVRSVDDVTTGKIIKL